MEEDVNMLGIFCDEGLSLPGSAPL